MFTALEIKILAGLALAAALLLGLHFYDAHQRALGAAENKAEVAQASMKIAQDNATKSAQIVATQQGVIHDAQVQASASSAAAARAAAARDAFRVQLDAYVSASRGPHYPGPASGSEAISGGDPIGVLADVLGRADARADITEGVADARRIRATACERAYDALSSK